ncbi:TipJ family phage tail tip protein [Escherichia coli]|uniref:TipJ family phage tail tip protein n=1 Tax=Escherichia coli TaxID=562 RepID=UPI003AF2AD25
MTRRSPAPSRRQTSTDCALLRRAGTGGNHLKGGQNPSEVRLLVQIQRNGGWVTEKDITIKGKTTSQYLASVVVDNLPPRPFNIRMRRMTPDSTTDQLQNKTLWSSYTEIIDVKQGYPNTALVGVQVDSEQFGSSR